VPTTATPHPPSSIGTLAAVWGILGIFLFIGSAISRLVPIAWAAVTGPLEWFHVAFGIVWTVFMAYTEGYRGFQKRFSPRVVARAQWLAAHPSALRVLLAPAFCMGYFHATRKRLIVSWGVTTAVALIIVVVKLLPSPWRGLVDIGVVVGLSWGLAAVVVWGVAALRGRALPCPPDVPEPG